MGLIQQTFKELKTVAEDLERVNAKVSINYMYIDELSYQFGTKHIRPQDR